MDGNELVIVEVKTRNTMAFGSPAQAVNRTKQQHLIRAANAYAKLHGLYNEIRFDIVSVLLNATTQEVEHIESAFYPTQLRY